MNAIKNKIQSRAGASITFALMLFLVCAVVSSIVIVSASTVSGRMSGLREMDSRYYAVTDAAEQLCGIFAEKIGEEKVTVDVKYTENSDGSIATANIVGTADPLLKEASEKLILSMTASGSFVAAATPLGSATDKFTGSDNAAYVSSITGTLQNGLLTFDISANKENTDKIYNLSLTFASNIKKGVADPTNPETSSIATVSWKLRDIRKSRATPTQQP